jgi:hypothetical protein
MWFIRTFDGSITPLLKVRVINEGTHQPSKKRKRKNNFLLPKIISKKSREEMAKEKSSLNQHTHPFSLLPLSLPLSLSLLPLLLFSLVSRNE